MRKDPVWEILAYSFLLSTAKDLGKFTTEDLRILSSQRGFRAPDDARAWGPVLQRAKDNQLVRTVGFRTARIPDAKSRLVAIWEWCGWH